MNFSCPCDNCLIQSICTEFCPKFNSHKDNLVNYSKEAQKKYAGYRGSMNNIMSIIKSDLVDILELDPKAKKDKEFYKFVQSFDRMYTRLSYILENKQRRSNNE